MNSANNFLRDLGRDNKNRAIDHEVKLRFDNKKNEMLAALAGLPAHEKTKAIKDLLAHLAFA